MKRKPINWFKARIVVVSFLLFIVFLLITGRMFQLQVLKKEQLFKMAAQQQQTQIPLVPKRGTIYDRKGNELAVSIEVDSIYGEPRKVLDPEQVSRDVASVLQIDRVDLKEKLQSRKSFEWIERKISHKESEAVKALRLPGIYFLKENRRFYPNSQLAAHVIGFVGLDSKGLEGVELQYDSLLQGQGNVSRMARDAMGREIAFGEGPFEKEDHYRNVTLTIDRHIQHVMETELAQCVQKWSAKGGMAIAMEPRTGKIVGLASYPFFNPNQFIQYRSKSWRNRAISDTFEPGSMFKAFLAAAAVEEKIVRPADSFYCENGVYKVHDRTIHDHHRHGWLTFQQIIKFSSNIGASKVGEKMGKDLFYRYIGAFGFGEKTRIGLPGEAKGILHHPRYWSAVSLDTISFGQGISVTGIQLVAALSAVANGGLLMKPYVVEKITNEKGEVVQSFQPEAVRRVLSETTANVTTALLKSATEKGGTGESGVPAGYEVAGKTGTAQKVDGVLGGYAEGRYNSGFMAFAPAHDPRLALLVVIDEPQGSHYGGVVAAPACKVMMEKVLPYLNVMPSGTQVVRNASEAPAGWVSNGEPGIEEVKIGRGAATVVMPDLTGLSMRNALSRIEGKGLIIKVSGNGRVIEQTPTAGAVVEKGDICFLKFQSPS